jgi:hypothetical protein
VVAVSRSLRFAISDGGQDVLDRSFNLFDVAFRPAVVSETFSEIGQAGEPIRRCVTSLKALAHGTVQHVHVHVEHWSVVGATGVPPDGHAERSRKARIHLRLNWRDETMRGMATPEESWRQFREIPSQARAAVLARQRWLWT